MTEEKIILAEFCRGIKGLVKNELVNVAFVDLTTGERIEIFYED